MENNIAIQICNVNKKYRLGEIGGGTLRGDLQSWWAKVRHKEDPNSIIGTDTAKYGEEFLALNDINLEIKKGEAIGIIGHNGAGKSTLLKLLSRVTAPTEGEIRINGRIASMLEVGTGFHPELTGRENIYMNGAILGMSRKEVDSKIEEIIDFSECRQFIDTPVKRYSSGMYVKLAFAVAAHLDAEIMVMDEVLAVGDAKFQNKCLSKMGSEAKEGKTILYVSHNMGTIRRLCDRCIVLSKGKIIFDGASDEAISKYMESNVYTESIVDLESIPRRDGFINHRVTMSRLEIYNDKFEYGGVLEGKLNVKSSSNYDNTILNISLHTDDGIGVTCMTTDKAKLSCGDNEIEYKLDLDRIAPGRYVLYFSIYELNTLGIQNPLDGLHGVYSFEIVADENFNNGQKWPSQYWGYFVGHKIEMKE